MKCKTGNIMNLSGKTSADTSSSSEPIGLLQSLSCSTEIISQTKDVEIMIIDHDSVLIMWEGDDVVHINVAIGTSIQINGPPCVTGTSSSLPFQQNPTALPIQHFEKNLSIVYSTLLRR